MHQTLKALACAALCTVVATAAHAAPSKDVTVLEFPLLHLPLPLPFFPASDLVYQDTVGGKLTVSAGDKSLSFSLLGELGVSSNNSLLGAIDLSLGKDEQITFSFEKDVSLLYWDLDDFNLTILLPEGSDKFSLSVDGKAAQVLGLGSHQPGAPLVGKTFTFGYTGDNYFIDTVKFGVTAVPETGTLAQLGLGLGRMGGLFALRGRQGKAQPVAA